MTSDTVAYTDSYFDSANGSRPAANWSAGHVDGVADLSAATSVAETLDAIVRLAWWAFGADAAGILLVGDGGVASIAASGAEARRADCLQVDHLEGPGLQAIGRRQPVLSPELRFDSRWRFWAPQAADLGFRSVLSLPLVDRHSFGAVTLYSDRPANFDTALLAPGRDFVQHAWLAITAAFEMEKGFGVPTLGESSAMHQATS